MKTVFRRVRNVSALPKASSPGKKSIVNEEPIEKSALGVSHARSGERSAMRPSQNVKDVALPGEYVMGILRSMSRELQLLNQSMSPPLTHLHQILPAILA